MRRLDTYRMHQEIHKIEVQQLKDAVKAFGGEIHFGLDYIGEFASGTEKPCVCVNPRHGEDPLDMYINGVSVDKHGYMTILAVPKDGFGEAQEIGESEIEFGHISFITDLVPDVDVERKEKKERLVMETAIFMAWDMFTQMYFPKKGWGQFEVCHEIMRLAEAFESTRKYRVEDDDYDEGRYFDELMAFEKKYLDEFKKML